MGLHVMWSYRGQVLEAQDGATAVGWPAFHKSTVHSSPFLYDIDRDGVEDIGLATFDGKILFFKDTVCGANKKPSSIWFLLCSLSFACCCTMVEFNMLWLWGCYVAQGVCILVSG